VNELIIQISNRNLEVLIIPNFNFSNPNLELLVLLFVCLKSIVDFRNLSLVIFQRELLISETSLCLSKKDGKKN